MLTLLLLGGCGGSALSSSDGSTGGAASAGAAGGSGVGGSGSVGASCTIGDKTYASGTGSFLGPDGCNHCSCLDGKLACTVLACEPPPRKLCGLAGACDPGEYCRLPDSARCGTVDQSGECTSIPASCTANSAPVCGCDEKQYGNACFAARAGVSVAHTGPCAAAPPGSCSVTVDGARYPDGTNDIPAGDACNVCTCRMGTLTCTARPCKAPTPCGGFVADTCAPDEYCAYDPEGMCGFADAESICKPRPSACSTLYQPVCGCDGKTYTNTCSAARERSGVLQTGACPGSCVVGDVIYPDGTVNIQGSGCSFCTCSHGTLLCDQRGC